MTSPQQHGGSTSSPSAVAEAARPVPWPVSAGGPATEGCDAVLVWTPAERRLLEALPDPGEVLDDHVWCGLEHDHAGPHWALAQVSGEDFWWLRWSEATAPREFVHHPVCARRRNAGEIGEPDVPCALPLAHAGAHSYTRPA